MKSQSPDHLQDSFFKFKEGDDKAFAFFYEFYIDDLYAYGISLGAEKGIVEDTIQDIFVKIYFNEKDFASVDHLKYFLLRSVKNRLYDIYKSKEVTSKTDIGSDILNFSITTSVLDDIIGEEDRAIIQRKINNLLDLLTPRQKEAIYLRFMQELEYSEIAEMLDMSIHSVRKLVSRSLKRLKEDQQLKVVYLLFLSLI